MSDGEKQRRKTVRTCAVRFVVAMADRQIKGGFPQVLVPVGAIFNHQIVDFPSTLFIPCPA